MATSPIVYGSPFGYGFYGGAAEAETLVESGISDFNFAGRDYLIDWKADQPLIFQSVPTVRQQQDISDAPGEHSLNPEGLWRRTGESWHFGAGQIDFDRKESNSFRFDNSFGLDTWTKWQITTLKSLDAKTFSLSTNQYAVVAGTRLYWTEGLGGTPKVRYITDMEADTPTITDCTGHPANAASSIVSDGFHVFTAHGSNGVYSTNTGTNAMTQVITAGTVDLLGYVRNRVMAGSANKIYDITVQAETTPGALPAALFTHPNTNFTFKSFAEGSGFIYAAGYAGNKSLIYRIALTQDGTALAAPTVAAEVPTNEKVECIYGYLGKFVFIGSNLGWRLAVVQDNGDLTLGVLITTAGPVYSFYGEGPFVYYGINTFVHATLGTTWNGIGRISTQFFTDLETLQPAYSNDIMAVTGLTVTTTSIGRMNGRLWCMLNGFGIVAETDNLQDNAYFDTGSITYGMTEHKRGLFIDHHHSGLGGIQIYASIDGGTFGLIGEHMVMDPAEPMPTFALGEPVFKAIEFRYVFHPEDGVPTAGLTFKSWLLRVEPRPEVSNMIYTTIRVSPNEENLTDYTVPYSTQDEMAFLESLHQEKSVQPFLTPWCTTSAVLEDWEVVTHNQEYGRDGYQGANVSILLKLKRISAIGASNA